MNRLKKLRKNSGKTQKKVFEDTGIPIRSLQNWENGERQINAESSQKLAKYFDVSVGYLLGFEQQLINDNENTRLNKEFSELNHAVAKANLLDVIIEDGYILQSTLDKCIAKLDEIDQKELKTWKN
ncbi:phage protein [Streptococcus dysgalactiae subsp. equisimilis]|uniref:helix-turn-helix domain-containing protein n=1 Tax=Streptococcus dysgalactiae TaxID=1334 RepID=UPI0010DF6DC1|nr:helix-turn-helix transcriptional regulator [Streptococcus dysgalactiae]VTT18256.1 phage protein [Streptococcus dysgalactiae subsp. equisimilis]VTT18296.1 phage protein [Streptococcus dysgalactiae subsp. equisimilis]VTT18335.1 phage protein [Streptococcus dysgalactiae subsp. equisimilis]VTT19284.1 phage protein [Streptococcus dysgalactiae subsp. equisimilis]VTT22629.1 phage protein [Streptococcus dysgalactiae subsp. equisimilis]